MLQHFCLWQNKESNYQQFKPSNYKIKNSSKPIGLYPKIIKIFFSTLFFCDGSVEFSSDYMMCDNKVVLITHEICAYVFLYFKISLVLSYNKVVSGKYNSHVIYKSSLESSIFFLIRNFLFFILKLTSRNF